MAIIIGRAGEYQQERAIQRKLNAVGRLIVLEMLLIFGLGVAAGAVWLAHPAVFAGIALLTAAIFYSYVRKRFEREVLRARIDQRGADGEANEGAIFWICRNISRSSTT